MPKSFEDKLIAKIDREGSVIHKGEYYTENEQFNKKIAAIWNDVRPRYRDFLPLKRKGGLTGVSYSLAELSVDEAKVETFRNGPNFVNERSDHAVGLEYSIMEAIQEHGWLGPKACVTPSNEYDDYINGIDFVVSIEREDGSYFHFGIDTTTSLDGRVIDKKIFRTVVQIQDEQMTQVKYFINDRTGERKSLRVPRFVTVTSPETARQLQNDLVKNPELIDKDVAQQEILDELEAQALFMVEEIKGRKNKFNNPSMLQAYSEVLDYVRKLKNEKTLDNTREYSRVSLELILSSLERFRKKAA